MIDRESVQAVTRWLRLGDSAVGRAPLDGRCDRCGGKGYLSPVEDERLCAECHLGEESPAS